MGIPYAFLEDMKHNFISKYGREKPLRAIAFSMNEAFSVVIKDRMEYYNSPNPNIDNIGVVRNQIDEVKDIMVQNIEKVLERGEKIELLVDKTDRLNQQAYRFQASSRELRRAIYWRKIRTKIGLSVIIIFLLYIASSSLCGFDFHRCKKTS